MTNNESFVKELLRKVPELENTYEQHMANNDSLLPHVLMGDVTRFVLAGAEHTQKQKSIARLLEYFEIALQSGSDEVKELIVVSFVENLIGEDRVVAVIKPFLGKHLSEAIINTCNTSPA